MSNTALIFVGQGAQQVGMGKDLFADFQKARELFELSNEILGFDLSKIMFEGPPDLLTESKNTQPALFLHSFCLYSLVKDFMKEYEFLAGHSLGEYTAYAASGAISFDTALKIVRKRGELMSEAGGRRPGKMAAIVGLSDKEIEDICAEIQGIVVPANYNSLSQVVISGESDAVEKAVGKCKEKGAKRCVFLEVSAAFHSPLMEDAAKVFSDVVSEAQIEKAEKPVIANISAKPISSPQEIREAMKGQMTGPVKWMQTVKFFKEKDVTETLEFSTKPVLSSLVKKTEKDIQTICISDTNSVKEFIKEFGG
ncbi:ACP S-malonyltransferase [candidate division WOR-3 bacterium]|nr:ACP S-malonyltransferase [candidate division WOR-3 bacterium]